ncbi:hypothetical protein WJX73_009926 [Symbiochloris irregularis]|uniref:Uncharacterized protein n=1 Tax=Symbiochloris irregularis TaxID=706552 RepID=A0AAW1NRE5_9CHLO
MLASAFILLLIISQRGGQNRSTVPHQLLHPRFSQVEASPEADKWSRAFSNLTHNSASPSDLKLQLQALLDQDIVYGNARREHQIAARLLGYTFAIAAFPDAKLAGQPAKQQPPVPQRDLDEYLAFLLAAQGRCTRLEGSMLTPLGPSPPFNPLCQAVTRSNASSIAIVGNGPLSQKDRDDIQRCDVIVRFNLMNNWVRYKERVDVWVMRFSSEALHRYWGLTNFHLPDANRAIDMVQAVWLVGGVQQDADYLIDRYASLDKKGTVLLNHMPLAVQYARCMQEPTAAPSTGFVAILAALHCSQSSAQVHIFGMNWSGKMWHGHKGNAERDFVAAMEQLHRMTVHPTACQGMRECGGAEIDLSCHWGNHGAYMCLLPQEGGTGRVWTDMTHRVPQNRIKELATGRV